MGSHQWCLYVVDSTDAIWYFTCHLPVAESRATMFIMARLREDRERPSALLAFCLALSLGLTQGCARSEPLHRGDAGSAATEQRLPFHSDTDQNPANGGAPAAAASDPKQAASLPFRVLHPRILPAGTLLTVQLEHPLSTAKVRAGDAFTSSVAAPFTTDGDILLEGGTTVRGRVESVQSLTHRGLSSGYFRLTLNSISVDGRQLALQTSSLFARGTFQPAEGVGVRKGHRLTFRLTAPVTLDASSSITNRQSPIPATE